MRQHITALLCATALLAVSGTAQAQSALGAGVIWAPKFEGAKDNETRVIPMGRLAFGNIEFDGGSARLALLNGDQVQAGAQARYRTGREEKDAAALRGTGDVDDAVDLGVFARTTLGQIRLQADAGYDVAGPGGLSAEITASWQAQMTPRTLFIPAVTIGWADAEYMKGAFGVTEGQAAGSGLSEYRPGGGLKSVSGSLTVIHALSERWAVTSVVGRGRLASDAAHSPIVREAGDRNQTFAIVGVTRQF